MKRFLLIQMLLLAGVTGLIAQSTWDGGGDGTSWNDDDNWDPTGVPAAGTVVTIGMNVTITGTATAAPARLLVTSNNIVTLDLNLNIGDGTTAEHAVKVQGNGTLNFGTGATARMFTINAPTSREGLQHNANTNPAVINIAAGATVDIVQADDGVLIEGTGDNVINNFGTLMISNANSDGIDLNSGSFVNDGGTLTIDDANTAGINNKAGGTFVNQNGGTVLIENTSLTTNNGIQNAGTFTNNEGSITVDNANTDGIQHDGGTLTNSGTITITTTATNTDFGLVAESTVENTGSIDVSGVDDAGIYVNTGAALTNDGSITANTAGSGTTRHAIFVEDGTLTNNGELAGSVTATNARTARTGASGNIVNNNTMTLSGGNDGQRLRLEGTATNGFGAELDLGDGRVILEANASFTNNGLLLSTRSSSPVFRNAAGTTATNNAFYDGNNGATSPFSTGTMGTDVDNGIDLNDTDDTSIDAMMDCLVDLAEQPYIWTDNNGFTATAAADGTLNTEPAAFGSQPVTLTTTIQGTDISVEISNLCADALPVELISFTGTPMEKSVMLKWQTANEENNDYMAVERSTDAREFTEVGRLAGAGYSSTTLDYALEDAQPTAGLNYYRLRQVDTDGTTYYSNVIAVRFAGLTGTEQAAVYPTVVRPGGMLQLDLRKSPEQQNQAWTLRGSAGQTLVTFTPEGELYQLTVPRLPAGMYLLTTTGNRKTTYLKFVIAD